MKGLIGFTLLYFTLISNCPAQVVSTVPLEKLLCAHKWKLYWMQDITGNAGRKGALILNITTSFLPDGRIETYTSGHKTDDQWILNPVDSTLMTNQLKDPKSGQIKEKIISLTDDKLVVWITYTGNKIMQYEYQSIK